MKLINKLGFDIVHGCQLQCVGCPNSTLKPKIKKITVVDFTRCLQNIDVLYIQLFRLFSFGELLLHGELPDILNALKQQNWSIGMVEISTNAQYHDFEVLTEAFKEGKEIYIVILIEFQSSPDKFMALRILHYIANFYIRLKESAEKIEPLPKNILLKCVMYLCRTCSVLRSSSGALSLSKCGALRLALSLPKGCRSAVH